MRASIPSILVLGSLVVLTSATSGCLSPSGAQALPNYARADEIAPKPQLSASVTPSPSPAPAPAVDLGEDVMKPMGELFGEIQASLPDATKNALVITDLKKIQDLVAIALVTEPQTDHYSAEVALVGEEAALLKYKSLLQALTVTLSELSATVQNAGTQACGAPCTAIVASLGALESVAHGSFRD